MMRTAFISTLTFFILAVPSGVAFAQVPQCSPPCPGDDSCQFINTNNTQTGCIPAATVDELVAVGPAPAHSSGTLRDIVNNYIIPFGNEVVEFLFAIAFLFFIYGIFKYFFAKGSDPKAQTDGRNFMLWSLVGFVHELLDIFSTSCHGTIGRP